MCEEYSITWPTYREIKHKTTRAIYLLCIGLGLFSLGFTLGWVNGPTQTNVIPVPVPVEVPTEVIIPENMTIDEAINLEISQLKDNDTGLFDQNYTLSLNNETYRVSYNQSILSIEGKIWSCWELVSEASYHMTFSFTIFLRENKVYRIWDIDLDNYDIGVNSSQFTVYNSTLTLYYDRSTGHLEGYYNVNFETCLGSDINYYGV